VATFRDFRGSVAPTSCVLRKIFLCTLKGRSDGCVPDASSDGGSIAGRLKAILQHTSIAFSISTGWRCWCGSANQNRRARIRRVGVCWWELNSGIFWLNGIGKESVQFQVSACPDIQDQYKLLELLGSDRINLHAG